MKKIFIYALIICTNIFADDYKTIENEAVKLIFKEGREKEAIEVANYIDELQEKYEGNKEGLLKQIPLILREESSISNALFNPALQKMEFYLTPMLDDSVGVAPWLKTLSIHEYRHYAQNKLATDNFTSELMYLLGGEFNRTILDKLMTPDWYYEGDAIYFETKMTEGGRGRNPNFLMEYRALLEDNKKISYEKAKNGSYKDYVPNHYYLGYLIVSYGYEKYGSDFWDRVIYLKGKPKTANFKDNFVPFSNGIKQITGLSSEEFYKKALDYYREKYNVEKTHEYESLNKEKKIYTNYLLPREYNGEIIAMKKSLEEFSSFYKIGDKKEEKLIDVGLVSYDYFSLRNNLIIWSEYDFHAYDSNKSYANIKLYDMKTGKRTTLTKKSSYFYPKISTKMDYIATIENKGIESTKIHLLDIEGKLINELPNKNDYQYNSVDWVNNDKELIISLRDKNGKSGLISFNMENKEEKILIPFGNYIISNISVVSDSVIFDGSFDLVRNAYRYSLLENKIYKMTQSNIGTSGGTPTKNGFLFSEYNSMGYEIKLSPDTFGTEINPTSLLEEERFSTKDFSNENIRLEEKESNNYKVKDYNSFSTIFKPYAWSFKDNNEEFNFFILSQNEIGDFDLQIELNENKKSDRGHLAIMGSYSKYWPIASFGYEGGYEGEKDYNKIDLKLDFPFNFSDNQYFRDSNFSMKYSVDKPSNENQYSLGFKVINKAYPSEKAIVPKYQRLELNYILDDELNNELSADFQLGTKAFRNDDGFVYEINYEKDNGSLKQGKDEIKSRGYNEGSYDEALKLSLDYHVPLFYPDYGVKGIYINRVKTNPFYDYTIYDRKNNSSSIGNSLIFEGKLISKIPFETEFKYSYLLEEKESKVDVGFKIGF